MNVLVTSSRNPFALDIERKLAEHGHRVWAADTFRSAAGSHSKYLTGHEVVASPRHATDQFVADVARIVEQHQIDVIIPAFEECFYLAARRADLPARATLYTGRFDQLARLHDKVSMQRIAEDCGVRIPQTVVATDDASLRAAIAKFPHYFARAAFSRGGVDLLTNTGPLAGAMSPDDCKPTTDRPWLVQEFVQGPMVCSYSTLHGGKVTAHCTYRAPRQWEHSTGITFLAVDGHPTLEVVQKIAEPMSYTGQLSFDFVESDGLLYLIECNPRSTDGALLVDGANLAAGLLEAEASLTIVEPGTELQLDVAVVASAFKEPMKELPSTIHDLLHVRDAGRGWHDHLPALWSCASLAHGEWASHRQRVAILEAMADDVVWNGQPIDGMSAADAELLADVHAERL